MNVTRILLILTLVAAYLVAAPLQAVAQNQNWDNRFDATLGLSGPVHAIAVDGANVYVGGSFTIVGGVLMNHIARWDGFAWHPLGNGLSGDVNAIAVSGSDVFVGGAFTSAIGVPGTLKIARWNGASWFALGSGLGNGNVNAIAVSGTDVYVGGGFTNIAGGGGALGIAKWNGVSWSALGAGVSDVVNAVAVSGADVFVGGAFFTAGVPGTLKIARWDGATWSALGSGLGNGDVNAITVSGTDVYVGGGFTNIAGGGGALRIARWNGSSWFPVGAGVTSGVVRSIAVNGTNVFAGGTFTTTGNGQAFRIAQFNGGAWVNLASGVSPGEVRAVGVAGLNVFVGGSFTIAGLKQSLRFGRWNESITPVFILGFDAREHADGLELSWRIFADEEIAGFRIYRKDAETAPFDLINKQRIIPREERSFVDTTIRPGRTYRYLLAVVKADGSEISSSEITATTPLAALELEQSFPNPFNPSTTIRFTLSQDAAVHLGIFDVEGRRVVTLVDQRLAAGPHAYQWNGVDAAGKRVSSGVYFYRLQAGRQTLTRKMILAK